MGARLVVGVLDDMAWYEVKDWAMKHPRTILGFALFIASSVFYYFYYVAKIRSIDDMIDWMIDRWSDMWILITKIYLRVYVMLILFFFNFLKGFVLGLVSIFANWDIPKLKIPKIEKFKM